jgi:hypothetical protein
MTASNSDEAVEASGARLLNALAKLGRFLLIPQNG